MLRHGSCVLVVVCVVVVLLLFVVNVLAIECWDAFANTADTLIVCAGIVPAQFCAVVPCTEIICRVLWQPELTHSPTVRARPFRSLTQPFTKIIEI